MTNQSFPANQIIFKEGDSTPCMYRVLSGQVGIFAAYGTEQEKQLTLLSPGQCFGEMGLLEQEPRSATAVSMAEDTTLRIISGDTFQQFFLEDPEAIFAIMQQMSSRIRNRTDAYLDVCHAISETLAAEQAGAEKSSWLKSRLQAIVAFYLRNAPDSPYRNAGHENEVHYIHI